MLIWMSLRSVSPWDLIPNFANSEATTGMNALQLHQVSKAMTDTRKPLSVVRRFLLPEF